MPQMLLVKRNHVECFSFLSLFKSLSKISVPCSLTYYFSRYLRGNIIAKKATFTAQMQYFSSILTKVLLCMLGIESTSPSFLWKMFLLLLVKMKILLIHMQIFMGMWFCF